MLRKAVKASENGVAASRLLYEFQTRTGRTETAAGVLEQSLSSHPDDFDLLEQLAADAIDRLEWQGADRYISRLSAIGQPDAQIRAAKLLHASALKRQRAEATDLLLEAAIQSLTGEPALAIRQVRSQVAQGRISDARQLLQDELAALPDDRHLRLLQASLMALEAAIDRSDGLVQQQLDGLR